MTSIEWTDQTVNFFLVKRRMAGDQKKVGWFCVKKSSGCAHCYAERLNMDPRALNSRRRGVVLPYQSGSVRELEPFFDEQALDKLLRKRALKRIFPNDMTDSFLSVIRCNDCDFVWEDELWAEGDGCGQVSCDSHNQTQFWPSSWVQRMLDVYHELGEKGHVIQTLTKRVFRQARELLEWERRRGLKLSKNVWLGFSAEDQKTFDERWMYAAQASRRSQGPIWVSYEPAIGEPVDFSRGFSTEGASLAWCVVGGESGRSARPFDLRCARSTIEQFHTYGLPVYVKQLGALPVSDEDTDQEYLELEDRHRKGGDFDLWPEDLRVREFPDLPKHFTIGGG